MNKYAVLIEKVTHVPGDERSRTNPGHGYPAHDVKSIEVREFTDKAGLLAWIEMQEKKSYTKPKYRAIEFKELTVSTNIVVDVN